MASLFHDTHSALEAALTCDLIASPIRFNSEVPEEGDDAAILAIATSRGYSQVLVRAPGAAMDSPVSRVAQVDVPGRRVSHVRDIQVTEIMAGKTSIGDALRLLAERPVYYLLEGGRLQMVLTRADLNSLPVQAYIGMLIAHLEGLMTATIVRYFPNDSWEKELFPSSLKSIKENYERLRETDFDTRRIDAASFGHKVVVLTSKSCRSKNYIPDVHDAAKEEVNRLKALRNRCFHSQTLTSVEEVAALANTVALARRWIEALAE